MYFECMTENSFDYTVELQMSLLLLLNIVYLRGIYQKKYKLL